MRTHLNGITALHLVVSLLYLLAAGFAFAGVLTLEELTGEKRIRTATQPPPPVAEQDTNWLAVKGAFTDTFGDPADHLASSGPSLGVLLMLLAISSLIGAVGLLKYQPWARRLLIVLSVIQLLNFPLAPYWPDTPCGSCCKKTPGSCLMAGRGQSRPAASDPAGPILWRCVPPPSFRLRLARQGLSGPFL